MNRTVVTFLIMVLAPPSAALAQGRGVFVDPESPAGKEYAIPLDQARRDAAGGANRPEEDARGRDGGGDSSGSSEPPLFGEGIGPSGGAARGEDAGAATTDGSDSSNASGQGETRGDGHASRAGELAPSTRGSAAISAAASDDSGALLTVGIGVAVLAVGLVAGFGLRRLLRES